MTGVRQLISMHASWFPLRYKSSMYLQDIYFKIKILTKTKSTQKLEIIYGSDTIIRKSER